MDYTLNSHDDLLLGDLEARLNRTEGKSPINFIGVPRKIMRRVLEISREILTDLNVEVADLKKELDEVKDDLRRAESRMADAYVNVERGIALVADGNAAGLEELESARKELED